MPFQTVMPDRVVKGKGGMDPKTSALSKLGISIGTKNIRSLQRADLDMAFVSTMHDSLNVKLPKGKKAVDPDRPPRMTEHLQDIHEAYQLLIKCPEFQIEEDKREEKFLTEEQKSTQSPDYTSLSAPMF